MIPIVKTLPSYIKDSQDEIFRDFFSLWTLHLFILSPVPHDEGFRALKHFSINALLRNLALKHCSVWPNKYSHSIAFYSVAAKTNKLAT